LVNTGWTGGPYGTGTRMKIAHTRAMIHSALSGQLDDAAYTVDPLFNLSVPNAVPGPRGVRRTGPQARPHVQGELQELRSGRGL
jgi:ATP-dependent phosphoenolpyruvate carboxykinase